MFENINSSAHPVASIILPTYNRASVLSRTIESVLDQTFTNFELIVVDDASKDETETVVTRYSDDRLFYVCHEENRGGSAARNTGIDHASGEYLFFIDSDDEWHPTKLEHQIDCLRSRSDECVAVYCLVDKEVSLNRQIRSKLRFVLPIAPSVSEGIEGDEEVIRDLLMMNFELGGASTLGVEHEIVEQIGGFDERFERHQDWEFLIRVLEHGKLACVQEPLVVKHDSGSPSADVYKQAKERYLEKFSEEIKACKAAGDDVMIVHQLNLSKRYLREGQLQTGIKHAPLSSMSLFHYFSFLWAVFGGIGTKGKQVISE